MPIDTQDTQPLSLYSRPRAEQETPQERYRRLKAFSDTTGVRLLFIYLLDEKQRHKAMGKKKVITYVPTWGGPCS